MTCMSGGKESSEGDLACANGRELKCSGGEWRETGYLCNNLENNEDGHIRITPDGRSASVYTPGDAVGVYVGATTVVGCVMNVVNAPFGQYRLFNSCPKCQIAVLSWNDGQSDRIRIEANQFADGYMRGPGSGFVIAGSYDC